MALLNMDYLLLSLYDLYQIFEEYRIPLDERARLLFYRRQYRNRASCEKDMSGRKYRSIYSSYFSIL